MSQLAHVSYVLTEEQQADFKGADYPFLTEPLTHWSNWLAIGLTLLIFLLVAVFGRKINWIRDRIRFFRGRSRAYQDYIPVILRLCVGMALIGAGSQAALISPAVTHEPIFANIQVILGFLLIVGLATGPTALISLGLAVFAVVAHPTLLDNIEIIAALLAILLLGQTKPGLDDLLGITTYQPFQKLHHLAPLILRFGLGGALLIMAIGDKLINPHWFGAVIELYQLNTYLPFSTSMWVMSATIIEITLGALILLGWHTRLASLITFTVLSIFFFIFKEDVYAHVTLFGTLFTLFISGGGYLSLDEKFFKKRYQN
jgi:uncharacterized membrane protein YphA (DoxX/SURF4 family)